MAYKPKVYLFEREKEGSPYTERSLHTAIARQPRSIHMLVPKAFEILPHHSTYYEYFLLSLKKNNPKHYGGYLQKKGYIPATGMPGIRELAASIKKAT